MVVRFHLKSVFSAGAVGRSRGVTVMSGSTTLFCETVMLKTVPV